MLADSFRIPEQEARAVWERATKLQARAETKDVRTPRIAWTDADLTLAQVVDAAGGAGIDPVFVQLAIAEQRLSDAPQMRQDRRTARWARALLGSVDAIEVAAAIPASPDRVRAAFSRVVDRRAFHMTLEDRIGVDPPLDGVLVYRIDTHAGMFSTFHGAMAVADGRAVLVTAEVDGDRTILRLRLPQYQHGTNLVLWGGITGGAGAAGGYGGASAGAALGTLIGTGSAALIASTAGVAALAAGALALGGSRAVARWGRKRGERELRHLLQAVEAEAAPR